MTTIDRLALAVVAIGLVALAVFAPRASRAAEYEIWAERASGALLREDEPNAHRIRDRNEEPFAGLEDCRQALEGVRIDGRLRFQSGWRLACRPVDVPLPRVVVR